MKKKYYVAVILVVLCCILTQQPVYVLAAHSHNDSCYVGTKHTCTSKPGSCWTWSDSILCGVKNVASGYYKCTGCSAVSSSKGSTHGGYCTGSYAPVYSTCSSCGGSGTRSEYVPCGSCGGGGSYTTGSWDGAAGSGGSSWTGDYTACSCGGDDNCPNCAGFIDLEVHTCGSCGGSGGSYRSVPCGCSGGMVQSGYACQWCGYTSGHAYYYCGTFSTQLYKCSNCNDYSYKDTSSGKNHYVSGYVQVCGYVDGGYYVGKTRVYDICDTVVTKISLTK